MVDDPTPTRDKWRTLAALLVYLDGLNSEIEAQETPLHAAGLPRWQLAKVRREASLAYFWYEAYFHGRYK